jgi:hypothetical protein
MIGTQLYKGQGFGNQLWVYAVTRSIALRKGFDFTVVGKVNFKGNYFLNLDFGLDIEIPLVDQPLSRIPAGFDSYYAEKKLLHPIHKYDISKFDLELYNVSDNTFIDGNMQTEKYISKYRDMICEWFSVPGDLFKGCTIHFRGTEYRGLKEVLVPVEYYNNGISYLRKKYGDIEFRVVTDDFELASLYFPEFIIIGRNKVKSVIEKIYRPLKARLKLGPNQKEIGRDFAALQNSKYLLIPNSSFSWWAAWTSKTAVEIVAPKYWARHNISNGFWSTGDILTSGWTWLDRSNRVFNSSECSEEIKIPYSQQ